MRLPSVLPAVFLAVVASLSCAPHCSDKSAKVEPLGGNQPVEVPGGIANFRVFRTPLSGPPVLLLHELPGLSNATLVLAQRLAGKGYTVYVPLLFGEKGVSATTRHLFGQCVFGNQFNCWRNKTSSGPIVDKLAVLAREIDARHEGEGIGAIGMCLTGAIPLELLAKGVNVKAGVLSQPTLPLLSKRSLAVPSEAIAIANRDKIPFIGARFARDGKSPAGRMQAFDDRLDHFTRHDIHGFPKRAHAVLTSWYCNDEGHPTRKVLDEIVKTFGDALK